MNPDLYIVRKVNEATSVSRKASLFMTLSHATDTGLL